MLKNAFVLCLDVIELLRWNLPHNRNIYSTVNKNTWQYFDAHSGFFRQLHRAVHLGFGPGEAAEGRRMTAKCCRVFLLTVLTWNKCSDCGRFRSKLL